jgi:hypothetical protein
MYDYVSFPSLIALGVSPSLIAFALIQIFGANVFTVATFFFINVNSWYIVWFRIAHEYSEYVKGVKVEKPEEPRQIPNLNEQYTLVTEGVKINELQQIAYVLLSQKAGGMKIDLREKFWTKKYTRAQWLEYRDMMERDGAITRTGRGIASGFNVVDWSKVRGYSAGRLPHRTLPHRQNGGNPL